MRREELYLADLIDNVRAVRGYLDGVTRDRWDAEDILRDAVLAPSNRRRTSWDHSPPPSRQRTSGASSATAQWSSGRRSRATTAWPWNANGGASWKTLTAYGPTTAPAGGGSRAT